MAKEHSKHDVVMAGKSPGVVHRAAKDGTWVDVKTDPKGPGHRVPAKDCKKMI
jgi:hypothetical protein